MECYRVGGAIRDKLLGQPVKENDYVLVGASPSALLERGFVQVGKDFPVFLHPETHEEYALARTERKTGKGYTGFSVYAAPEVTLLEDLKRRDLTINAIAETSQGELIDPYGGCQDIQNRILRHVSPAFTEDPVRVLRVARFMARFSAMGFNIDPKTSELMRTMVENKEIDSLVPERAWREFEKALAEPSPVQFVIALDDCGAWSCLCPEWKTISTDQQQQALNALRTATNLTQDVMTRFASLMQFVIANVDPLFSIQQVAKRWRLPKAYANLLMITARCRTSIHKVHDLDAESIVDLLEQADALRRYFRFEQLLTVCEADWKVRHPQENYSQKTKLVTYVDKLRSIDISRLIAQGLSGVTLGHALRKLRIEALKIG